MGKSDPPAAPDYKGVAIATSNASKFNEQTPYGTIGWSLKPGANPNNPQPGDYIRDTQLAPAQQQLLNTLTGNQQAVGNLASAQAGQLGDYFTQQAGRNNTFSVNVPQLEAPTDTKALQDALYRRSTQYYDQNFGDQESALRSQLLNSGLTQCSEAYDKAMRNFGQTRDTAYADAADRAVTMADESARANDLLALQRGQFGLSGEQAKLQAAQLGLQSEQVGQSNQNAAVQRLAQIMALSQGQQPSSANSASQSPDLLGAAQAGYNAQLGATNASNAQQGQTISALGTLGALAYML